MSGNKDETQVQEKVLTSNKEDCTADGEEQSEAEGDSADMMFRISMVDFEGHVRL